MTKHLLPCCVFAACAALISSAQNQSYFTDDLGELNGVSDNGRFAAVGDIELGKAYLWDSNTPNVFKDVTVDPSATASLPSAMQIIGTLAYDVTDDGNTAVGTLYYADGHSAAAYYKNGTWTALPAHAASLNTNEAIAITPDGKTICGYSFISDPTSEIAGRFYPVQWTLADNGTYELHAYTDIELPDHQGFVPMTQSPDGRIIAGTLYCAVQSTIPAMVIEGELKIFNELTEKSEPWIYRGKYYCGTDPETGNQIWSEDPNDPRIVLFTEYYINGFKDTDRGVEGAFSSCDANGNFYGTRTLITDVDAEGDATLTTAACIYNVNTDTWTDNTSLSFYTAGVGTDLIFASNGVVMVNGKKRYIDEEYGINSNRPIAGINKISSDGKVLGGMTYEINEATGTYQYFPFMTVTEGAFSGLDSVLDSRNQPLFVVSGNTLEVHNAETMTVHDLGGRLVATGKSVTVNSGVYIVKSGKVSAKVLVK